jgi:hypothetical protein
MTNYFIHTVRFTFNLLIGKRLDNALFCLITLVRQVILMIGSFFMKTKSILFARVSIIRFKSFNFVAIAANDCILIRL